MNANLWDQLSAAPLYLDGGTARLELIPEEIEEFYAPLARAALRLARPNRRALLAVAGPPGSGKSAFAALLTQAVNLLAGEEIAALVSLDGWHLPNAVLDAQVIQRGGQNIPLRQIKGAPETYDQPAACDFVRRAARLERLPYPIYSRETHDPLPAAGALQETHRLALLEGNYWLLDEPPWRELAGLYDLRIFLTAEPESLAAGLLERHLRGGKPPEAARAHIERADMPNIRRVLARPLPADVLVTKRDSRRIERMEWISSL